MTEDVEAGEALDEIISEDDFEGGVTKDILGRVDTEEAGEPVEQQAETGEPAFIESVEVMAEKADDPEDYENTRVELKVEPNEEVTLDSGKQAEEGENLSYIWYDFNDSDQPEEITEATGQPTYKLIADHNKKIRCEVTKDGQTIFAKEFTVTVNTGLEIESDDDYENYDAEQIVQLNGSVILKPVVTVADGIGLHYQWYEKNDGEEYALINGADQAEYQVNACMTTADYFRCVVTDDYGNSEDWVCRVIVRTLNIDERTKTVIGLKPEDSTVLQVFASSLIPDAALRYQWFKYNDTAGNWDLLENENAATLEVGALDCGYAEYECKVSDGFDETAVEFDIWVSAGMWADAEEEEVFVKAGEAVTLRVIASSDYPDKYPIRYQWYNEMDEEIAGATEASYTVPPVANPDRASYGYYCRVSDGYNSETLRYTVYIDTGLSVSANNVWVSAGAAAELKVEASTEDAYGPLKYEWRALTWDEEGEYWRWKRIANDGSAYVVANVQKLQRYCCTVSDKLTSKYVYMSVGLLKEREE